MGCCFGKEPGYGDYEDADRDEMRRAAETRIAKQEARGVNARAAAKLKANATAKHTDSAQPQDATMKWTMGS